MDCYFTAPSAVITTNNVDTDVPNYFPDAPMGSIQNCRWKATSPETLSIVKGIDQATLDLIKAYTDVTQLTYSQWQQALPDYS